MATTLDNGAALRQKSVDMFLANTPPLDGSTIDDFRAGFEALCANFEPVPGVRIEAIDAGGVPALKVTAPGASAQHLVIHFHSGGYVMGSANAYRNFACRLSDVSGATVIVPDYRLAPEYPYPAPVEDAQAVYDWCLKQWDASHIVISGDSAGGGLAMATLMVIRDSRKPMPAGGVAISPLLDLAGEGESCERNLATDPLIFRDMIVGMGKVYIGELDPHENPLASPLWGKHHGLPPLFLTASASEVLCDDSVRFVESVNQAGGIAALSMPDGLIHIWTLFPFLDEAKHSMAEIGAFVRDRLGLATA